MDFRNTAFAFLVDKSGSMATFEKANYDGLDHFLKNAPTGFYFCYTKHKIVSHVQTDILGKISFVQNTGDMEASYFEDGNDVQNNCTRLGDAIVLWLNSAIGPYLETFPRETTISLFFIIVSDGLQDSSIRNSISQTRDVLEEFRTNLSIEGRTVIPYIFYFGLNDFTTNVIDAIRPDAWCLVRKENASECYVALDRAMNDALEGGDVGDLIEYAKEYFNTTIQTDCEKIGISFNGLLNS